MAAQVSLMAYLQHGMPPLTLLRQGQNENNTTCLSRKYHAGQIGDVTHWEGFNLGTIEQRFGTILYNATITDEPLNPQSPRRYMNSETVLRTRVDTYLSNRLTRALRCGFQYNNNAPPNLHRRLPLTTVLYDAGNMAQMIEQFIPDIAYYDANHQPAGKAKNRVPGDIKPSYKWAYPRMDGHPTKNHEFRQALSQINWYMTQHESRYSFILTDEALVAVRRLDFKGNLELSEPIPWATSGMLAAHDQGPLDWKLPRPPPPPVPAIPQHYRAHSQDQGHQRDSGRGSGQQPRQESGKKYGHGNRRWECFT
ncbi:unnamed protein product [Penicillium manginii]